MIREYVSKGLTVDQALEVAGMPRSTYYYKESGGTKGRPCSIVTPYRGTQVTNDEVVIRLRKILEPDFIDYGYKRSTVVLKEMGYEIGKTKVLRLMREHQLLNKRIKGKHPGKKYVAYCSPRPHRPFQILEVDIKYVYIAGERRNAYLITILDTFHRQAYEWGLFVNMKTDKVLGLILQLIDEYLIPHGINPKEIDVIIRSDNGSQFIAHMYKQLLNDCGIKNNYIPPATPQMNGHIEAFHSTVQKLVCDKFSFDSFDAALEVFNRFFYTYNHIRIMEAILFKTPAQFFDLWMKGRIGVQHRPDRNHFYFKEEGTLDGMPSSLEVFESVKANLYA